MDGAESPVSMPSPGSEGPYSEVPTEPLPPSERQLVHEYMSRRQHFLSDFERYNPVQNMQMLAHHVFEVSESLVRLRSEVDGSRRLLDFVSQNQREGNESIRAIGHDMEKFDDKLSGVKGDVFSVKENASNFQAGVTDFQARVTEDISGLRQDINTLRTEMHLIREETRHDMQEIKQILTMMAVRG